MKPDLPVAGVVRGAEAAGGSILAAMQAREAQEARTATLRRQMIAATEADQARRAAEFEALPEAGKRKVKMEELKRLAELRKRGAGVGGKLP